VNDPLRSAARALRSAARLVVFTGAGVSKESGIPTFREPETGLWSRYDPMDLATPEAYLRDPAFVWRWYEHRFSAAAAAEPNPGHRAIAELEQIVTSVSVVTQNIDGLHQRAGSSDVVELHGSMHRFKCLRSGHVTHGFQDLASQAEKPPRCHACGDLLRPDVVWFGEELPFEALHRAQTLSSTCDVMLVVGTSGVVYPAAAMPLIAAEAGATVIDVNPDRDALAESVTYFLQGAGGEVLPRLVAEVRRPHQTGRRAAGSTD
jgi:NAD-dependent deacetylase